MFVYDHYVVVGTNTDSIYADLDNVYIPQDLLDHPNLVGVFEELMGKKFDNQVTMVIRWAWDSVFDDFATKVDTDEGKRAFNKLIQNKVPVYISNQFLVRKTDEYCYVTNHQDPKFVVYGIYDENEKCYMPHVDNIDKTRIIAAINNESKSWTLDDITASLELVDAGMYPFVTRRGFDSIQVSPQRIQITRLLEEHTYNGALYTLHIPELDITASRIKYNALSIRDGHKIDVDFQGAKLQKGIWKETKDKINRVDRPDEFYLNKFFKFCHDPSSDPFMDSCLNVGMVSLDLFSISNVTHKQTSVESMLNASLILQIFKDKYPREVAYMDSGELNFIDGVTDEEKELVHMYILSLQLQQ